MLSKTEIRAFADHVAVRGRIDSLNYKLAPGRVGFGCIVTVSAAIFGRRPGDAAADAPSPIVMV